MNRYVVSSGGARERRGVAADSVQQLREKAIKFLKLDPAKGPITLVLEDDGTIVEDDDYLVCLPNDTKLVALQGDSNWAPTSVDGGTAWLARDSVDEADSSHVPRWKGLAAELKKSLASIILFSESDYQTLIDVKTEELSREMGASLEKMEMLKETLQRLLDQREEERQCKELLELYLEAMKDDTDGPPHPGAATNMEESALEEEGIRRTQLPSHVLQILKEKPSPELSLSTGQLQAVCAEDPADLALDLSCRLEDAQKMQSECQQQAKLRHQQVQCMNTLAMTSLVE